MTRVIIQCPKDRVILSAVSQYAQKRLLHHEIMEGLRLLNEKAEQANSGDDRLWRTSVDGKEIWGYLDPQSGQNAEDILTLFLAEEYADKKIKQE